MDKTFIIAEAGVNHNGSIDRAVQLIDAAKEAGANAVKFQTFKTDALVSKSAPKAEYQTKTTGNSESQYEMLKKLELTEEHHFRLIEYCRKLEIEFLSTPFDSESLTLLVDTFKLKTIKIPSGEITNAPFLLEIAGRTENIILSTGMSTLADVEIALGVLAFGFSRNSAKPGLVEFQKAFSSDEGQTELRKRVILLHATTEYPAPLAEVNLRAMDILHSSFKLRVGYSDHTEGIHIPIAAVARGASVIEKHFTIDRSLPGPDHKASLEPQELKQMVKGIRDIEIALGDGVKRPTVSEWKNRQVARKSLVAGKAIMKGDRFDSGNLGIRRPGNGPSPFLYWEYLGKQAEKSYSADDLIE